MKLFLIFPFLLLTLVGCQKNVFSGIKKGDQIIYSVKIKDGPVVVYGKRYPTWFIGKTNKHFHYLVFDGREYDEGVASIHNVQTVELHPTQRPMPMGAGSHSGY